MLAILAAMVVVGLVVFGVLVRRATHVEQVEPAEALRRFEAVRSRFGDAVPMVEVDAEGKLVRHEGTAGGAPVHLKRIHLLGYRAGDRHLVQVDMPFWFFKLKAPTLEFVVKGQGVDLKSLGVTPADLERHGPGLVLEEARANGDRVLVWTE